MGGTRCVIPGHKTIGMNTSLLSHYQPKVWEKKNRIVLGRTGFLNREGRGKKKSATCRLFPSDTREPLPSYLLSSQWYPEGLCTRTSHLHFIRVYDVPGRLWLEFQAHPKPIDNFSTCPGETGKERAWYNTCQNFHSYTQFWANVSGTTKGK